MRCVYGPDDVRAALERLADEVAAEWAKLPADAPVPAIVGIERRGVPIGRRLQGMLEQRTGRAAELGSLEITLYRDDMDLRPVKPVVRGTRLDFDITGRYLLIVDDVLYTGRTIRAALTQLSDFGRPACIRLAVLADRGHHELPIAADFAGHRMETRAEDWVEVRVSEIDGEDAIELHAAPPRGETGGKA